jgi:arsenate reductase
LYPQEAVAVDLKSDALGGVEGMLRWTVVRRAVKEAQEVCVALRVYGIPSCGTVKKAQAWLEAQGAAAEFVDFRATPPTRAQVVAWVSAFGDRALRNTSGGSYRALPADKDSWDTARWIDAFTADPMLIKRPVIERDGAAVQVGFRGTDDELKVALIG